MTKTRSAILTLSMSASMGLAACGGDEKPAPAASAGDARTEAAATRRSLQAALTQLKGGDRKAAEDTVAEGYLQHFEEVEGALEDVDDELNEEIEDGLKEELRDKIRSGAPVAEVEKLIASLDADLAKAEQKLQ